MVRSVSKIMFPSCKLNCDPVYLPCTLSLRWSHEPVSASLFYLQSTRSWWVLGFSTLAHSIHSSTDTPEKPSLALNLLTISSKTDGFQKKIQNKSKIIVSKEWKIQNIFLCWRWFSELTPPLLKVWSIMIYCDWSRLLELDNLSLALN